MQIPEREQQLAAEYKRLERLMEEAKTAYLIGKGDFATAQGYAKQAAACFNELATLKAKRYGMRPKLISAGALLR